MGAEKEQNRQAGSRGVEENQEDLVMGWLGRDAAEGGVEAGTCSDCVRGGRGFTFLEKGSIGAGPAYWAGRVGEMRIVRSEV